MQFKAIKSTNPACSFQRYEDTEHSAIGELKPNSAMIAHFWQAEIANGRVSLWAALRHPACSA